MASRRARDGIKYGRAEFGFAGGYLQDSRNGPGAYGDGNL